MSDSDGDRLIILRFSGSDELKQFYDLFKDSELGKVVKVGDDSDYDNNKSKDRKKTYFSKLGLEGLDQKRTERANLI